MLDAGKGRGIVGKQMSEKNDGGPAFPTMVFQGDDHNNPEYAIGLTMRDWFAGQIAGHLVSNPNQNPLFVQFFSGGEQAQTYAEAAYLLADAMLAQRNKEPAP